MKKVKKEFMWWVNAFLFFCFLFVYFGTFLLIQEGMLTKAYGIALIVLEVFIAFWVYWFECLIKYNRRKRRQAKRKIVVEPSPFDLDMIEYRRAF